MARKTRIKWNNGAFEQIRRSPEVKRDLASRANRIKADAGEGFEVGTAEGKSRSRASVITATAKAQRKQARDNTLQRSLDAGRG